MAAALRLGIVGWSASGSVRLEGEVLLIERLRTLHPLWWILLAAFLVRVAAAVVVSAWLPEGLFPDRFTYADAASDVLGGNLIDSHLVMPLYPLLIALAGGSEAGQIAVSVVIGTVSVGWMYLLGAAVFEERRAGLIAASTWALYPPAVFYSTIGLTEIVFTTLLLGFLWGGYRRRWLLTGVMFTVAVLVRPSLELIGLPLVIWFALVVARGGWRMALRSAGMVLVAYLVLMAPWWIHQHVKYDEFVRLNLGGGVVLYAGNNPMNTSGGGIADADFAFSGFADISDPLERDRAMTEAALDYIRDDPASFLRSTAVKMWRFWRPWPHAPELQSPPYILGSLLVLPLIIGAGVGLVLKRKEWRRISPLVLLLAYLTAIHAVTIGSIRYRFPLEALLILLSMPAVLALLDRFSSDPGALLRHVFDSRNVH